MGISQRRGQNGIPATWLGKSKTQEQMQQTLAQGLKTIQPETPVGVLGRTSDWMHFHLHRLVHGRHPPTTYRWIVTSEQTAYKRVDVDDRPTYVDRPTWRGFIHFYSFLVLAPLMNYCSENLR